MKVFISSSGGGGSSNNNGSDSSNSSICSRLLNLLIFIIYKTSNITLKLPYTLLIDQ